MRVFRSVFRIPASLLSTAMIVIGLGLNRLARLIRWLEAGYANHVYYPVAVLARWSRSEPTWHVRDLIALKRQPRTAAHVAIAEADPSVIRVVCECSDPDCMVRKSKTPIYVPTATPAGMIAAFERARRAQQPSEPN